MEREALRGSEGVHYFGKLFNFIIYVFYCYVYVLLLYVYVFLLLCMICSLYFVSLCCFVYFLFVNGYCTTVTGFHTNCSSQLYLSIYISVPPACFLGVDRDSFTLSFSS